MSEHLRKYDRDIDIPLASITQDEKPSATM